MRSRVLVCSLLVLAVLGCNTPARRAEQERDRRRAQSHFNIGVDHLKSGRAALALRELLQARELDSANAEIRYALADAYIGKSRFAEAEAELLKALELRPDYHDARVTLSRLYIHLERYPEAIAQCQILTEDPTFPSPWVALTNRGWAEYKRGDRASARRAFEEAFEFNDRYWRALLNLGILARDEGKRSEAIRLFEQVLELRPNENAAAEVNYHLAGLYADTGKRDRARDHLRKAVVQDPDGTWGRKSEQFLKQLR
jgi:tetratricopeptide (TPR) repeat protein